MSYDIQTLDSAYRRLLAGKANVELRHASFAASAAALRRESPFDLILWTARIRLSTLWRIHGWRWNCWLPAELWSGTTTGPMIITRRNCACRKDWKYPKDIAVYAVRHTMCAVHVRLLAASSA